VEAALRAAGAVNAPVPGWLGAARWWNNSHLRSTCYGMMIMIFILNGIGWYTGIGFYGAPTTPTQCCTATNGCDCPAGGSNVDCGQCAAAMQCCS